MLAEELDATDAMAAGDVVVRVTHAVVTGAGRLSLPRINDAGYWMFAKFVGLEVGVGSAAGPCSPRSQAWPGAAHAAPRAFQLGRSAGTG